MTPDRNRSACAPSDALLGRNDRRILDMVCRANGGGVDLTQEPWAPTHRLIKRGLIQRKSHTRLGSQPWVHTEAGWKLWSAQR